jgi:cysteine desulfurase
VLRAMGLPRERTRNALRFSLGPGNTIAEIDAVIARLPALVERLRRLVRPAVGRR